MCLKSFGQGRAGHLDWQPPQRPMDWSSPKKTGVPLPEGGMWARKTQTADVH